MFCLIEKNLASWQSMRDVGLEEENYPRSMGIMAYLSKTLIFAELQPFYFFTFRFYQTLVAGPAARGIPRRHEIPDRVANGFYLHYAVPTHT